MSRKQITDPDLEVIGMANANAARRRRVAANRATLKQLASENKKLRKAAWWKGFRSMMFEAGASAATGVIFVLAMGNGLVDPIVGVPMLLACMLDGNPRRPLREEIRTMHNYRIPNETEIKILKRNGIDPEGLVVCYADDDCIRVLRHKTRDIIAIHRGDMKWS